MMATRRGLADEVAGEMDEGGVESVKKIRSGRAAKRELCRADPSRELPLTAVIQRRLQSISINSPLAVKNAALTTCPA